jgi:hypothetical protein
MTTNKLQLTVNILFIAYCIGLVVAITSVNTELKKAVDNRQVYGGNLQVHEGNGYQSGADQWFAQRGLNFEPSTGEFVQQSDRNKARKYQPARNNYSQPVQKTAQMYQYQLINAELVR